eukprot:CAMPEP_0195293212 /NCGR_PEP_ID=MMETSP0707-20130614/11987_1 /TAXON_ID=33640 /ORGANISM="Asterionellopsis glacialis, Strain CCMP134" /LENGTH=357 /DNA_ID=CAMNT_0040353875 /DNA_START=17 /DNA_END=1090 /DNA_ORIENTATION=-
MRHGETHIMSAPGMNYSGKQKTNTRELHLRANAVDHLQVMMKQEASTYVLRSDYLHQENDNLDQVNDSWRRKICEWSFEVVDHFGFDREVVSIALNYLDRFVASNSLSAEGGSSISRREFQLVAVTSLYLAIKLHGETDSFDGPRRKLKIGAFVELSRGLFNIETLETMENGILNALEWRMNPPTTVRFVACLLRQLPEWPKCEFSKEHGQVASSLFEMSRYLTELSVCVSSFLNFNPSVIAYAAILCSMDALSESAPIPYECRLDFLNNVLDATGLGPEDQQVRQARAMLQELAPSLFEKQQPSSLSRSLSVSSTLAVDADHQCGKTSPVCVVQETEREYTTSHRKRGRFLHQAST